MSTTKALKEAIEIFELRKKLNGWLCEADTVALAALRDAEQRRKGCAYCNRDDVDETVCYIPNKSGGSADIPYNICSNCGRVLTPKEDI